MKSAFAETASIERRLRFSAWNYTHIRAFLRCAGLGKLALRLGHTPHGAANLIYDLIESPRSGFRLSNFGQVNLAALDTQFRLPQLPRYQGYWYDRPRHALVGMHLGLDILRNQGRYYLIESNVSAALGPKRRSFYGAKLDPFIRDLLHLAEQNNFRKLVLYRAMWPDEYFKEFALAQRESGIEVVGTSSPMFQPTTPHPMLTLPEELESGTIYVLFSPLNTPLSLFLHDKLWTSRWLQEAIARHPSEAQLLADIPTFDRLFVPELPSDPRWPNLVAKLASLDRGKFVLMGRFRSEQHARQELMLQSDEDIPGVFRVGLKSRITHRISPWLQTIYQPFIPPETIDGALSKIRMHLFISPLANLFHSALHGVTPYRLSMSAPEGLIEDIGPYTVISSSAPGYYVMPDRTTETELRQVADEFGQIAGLAVRDKFVTTPD